MSLYLYIPNGNDELDGMEICYAEFGIFRNAIVRELEGGVAGSKFPTLILHSDCDGTWSPSEAQALEQELRVISKELRRRPPIHIATEWRDLVLRRSEIRFKTLYDCFFDAQGEALLGRLTDLAKLSQQHGLPIVFM